MSNCQNNCGGYSSLGCMSGKSSLNARPTSKVFVVPGWNSVSNYNTLVKGTCGPYTNIHNAYSGVDGRGNCDTQYMQIACGGGVMPGSNTGKYQCVSANPQLKGSKKVCKPVQHGVRRTPGKQYNSRSACSLACSGQKQ